MEKKQINKRDGRLEHEQLEVGQISDGAKGQRHLKALKSCNHLNLLLEPQKQWRYKVSMAYMWLGSKALRNSPDLTPELG